MVDFFQTKKGPIIRWDDAFSHEDGPLCVYSADSGIWYCDNDGKRVHMVRKVCTRAHVVPEVERSE